MTTTTCLSCGSLFSTFISEIKRGGGKYCSIKCYRETLKGRKRTEEAKIRIRKSVREARHKDRVDPKIRFMRFVRKIDSGCWEWVGAKRHSGYGVFFIPDVNEDRAHRVSYILFKSSISKGMTIDHLCKHPWCVNPSHLEEVTMRENIIRGSSFAGINYRKKKCLRGHDITKKENYYLSKSGGRQCKQCTIIRAKINRNKY